MKTAYKTRTFSVTTSKFDLLTKDLNPEEFVAAHDIQDSVYFLIRTIGEVRTKEILNSIRT